MTEASVMQFPPNATRDESNFELNLDGSRSRRLGMNVHGSLIDTGFSQSLRDNLGYTSFIWEGPGGDSSKKFLVIQVGDVIRVFDSLATVISNSLLYTVTLNGDRSVVWGITSYGGKVYITTNLPEIQVIEYTPSNGAFASYSGRIKIRDLFGVEETIEPKYEEDQQYRGALNTQHYYNLYNQSWAIPRFPWLYGENPLQNVAILAGAPTRSPSNSDTVWMGMDFRTVDRESVGTPAAGSNPGDQSFFYTELECFNRKQFDAVTGEQGWAAKGHYIIDAFETGASRTQALINTISKYPQSGGLYGTVVFQELISGGPKCCASYAGRIFYSGISPRVQFGDRRTPDYSNFVFFSQLVEKPNDAFKCYQEGDPTSRETNDIIDTDGGFLKIAGASGIQKLVPLGARLIVIAENGIWSISGEDSGQFKATGYKVDKVSTNGCLDKSTVVDAGDTIYYFGADAIYRIQPNQFGDLGVTDITSDKIKKFYANMTITSKRLSHGVFDRFTNRVHWYSYDRSREFFATMLSYDLKLESFYPFTLMNSPAAEPILFGEFLAPDTLHTGVAGTTPSPGGLPKSNKMKCAGISRSGGNLQLFFSEFYDPDFIDWKFFDGVGTDARAYMLVGETTLGDVAVDKQLNYLTVIMKNTERSIVNDTVNRESSCLVRAMWDFADSIVSNRWSRTTQVFRRQRTRGDNGSGDFYSGHEYLSSKSKMRGRGKAFSLYFSTEPKKDCHVVGWNLELTVDGVG